MPPSDPPTGPTDAGDHGPELADLYDPATLDAIEAWARRRVAGEDGAAGPPTTRGPRTLGASMLAAGMLGLGEVLEGRDRHHEIIEEARDEDGDDEPVTFVFVPGDPRASRIIVRPWLL